MRRLRPLALVLACAGAAGCGADGAPPAAERADPRRHFAPVAAAAPREEPRGRFLTGRLRGATWLHARRGGRRLARLPRRTEFGTPQVLPVLARRDGWLRVQHPELPNGRSGWIRAAAADLGATDWSAVVDLSERRLTLRRKSKAMRRVSVAIGRPGAETPTGRFAVTDHLSPSDADSPYGCCVLALTGHQTQLDPRWPGGDRLAIHGTPATETIGTAASLGCLRAHARDLRALMRRLPPGAPVFIRA